MVSNIFIVSASEAKTLEIVDFSDIIEVIQVHWKVSSVWCP